MALDETEARNLISAIRNGVTITVKMHDSLHAIKVELRGLDGGSDNLASLHEPDDKILARLEEILHVLAVQSGFIKR